MLKNYKTDPPVKDGEYVIVITDPRTGIKLSAFLMEYRNGEWYKEIPYDDLLRVEWVDC